MIPAAYERFAGANPVETVDVSDPVEGAQITSLITGRDGIFSGKVVSEHPRKNPLPRPERRRSSEGGNMLIAIHN
jgi:hypothetical protein